MGNARPHGRQRHHDHPPQLHRQPRTYAAEGDAWISDVVYHADDEEAGETEIPLARRGLITFATAANATGEPRTATVGFSVTDADGNVFGDSFTVTQSADEARISGRCLRR